MTRATTIAIWHFGFLAGVSLYFAIFYPACTTLAMLLLIVGAAVEFWLRISRTALAPEMMLGCILVAAWWTWPSSAAVSDIYRAAALLAAYVILIHSRAISSSQDDTLVLPESDRTASHLKWLILLIVPELVFGTRLPGSDLPALMAIAIGLSAVAVDSWLDESWTAHSGIPPRSAVGAGIVRWAILPLVLVLAATAVFGSWVVETTADYHDAQKPARSAVADVGPELLDLQETMSLGDRRSIERDPRIVARLSWESGPPPTGMVYLRTLTLPDLVVNGPTLEWIANSGVNLPAATAPAEPTRWMLLHRTPSRSDVAMHLDGNDAVDLPGLSSDEAGNLYSPALKNREYVYRVGFQETPMKADPCSGNRASKVDPRLNELPWQQVEDPRWQSMAPERVAAAVCSRLQSLCSYELQNLRKPTTNRIYRDADGTGRLTG